jgi:hypothetical protein
MKKVLLMISIGLISILGYSQTSDCKSISKEVDEFDGKITFRADVTPFASKNMVSFVKFKYEDSERYYLSMYIAEPDIYTGKGAYIILNNGEKISKPSEKVDYKLLGSQFYTRAYIRLTEEDIVLLKESGIKKFKLYISTGELNDKDSEKSKEIINCLIKAE